MYYEMLKQSGELPIVGVNTFLSPEGSPILVPDEVIRATKVEKKYQVKMLKELHKAYEEEAEKELEELKHTAMADHNIFEKLMDVSKYCSLHQITNALFEAGGRYRRNM